MFFKKQEECEKNYKLGRTLGTGSFATVQILHELELLLETCQVTSYVTDFLLSIRLKWRLVKLIIRPGPLKL